MPKLPRLTAKEAEKLLLDAGFSRIRSKGSHRIYRKEEIRIVIPSKTAEEDPILDKFLDFLAQDMEQNPQQIQPVTSKTLERVQSLVEDVEVNLNALPDKNE